MSRRAVTEEMADRSLYQNDGSCMKNWMVSKGQKKKRAYKLIKEAMDQELISKAF